MLPGIKKSENANSAGRKIQPTHSDPIRGQIALLTGASGGLGPHIARALAARGARLFLTALPGPELDAITEELREQGAEVYGHSADLTNSNEMDTLLDAVNSQSGTVAILINNAGTEQMLKFHEQTSDDLERIVEVNLMVPLELSRRVLPGMLQREWGRIINISSIAAKAPPPYATAYAATKAALIALSQSIRAEYREYGISASAVVPGFVRDAGMYHRASTRSGVQVSRLLGTSSPVDVAQAVIRALDKDQAEIIVNKGPMRFLAALIQLSPDFGTWIGRLTGADKTLRGWANINESKRPATRLSPAGGSRRNSQ
jgi:short-subunit dehydrogenase